MSSVRRRSTPCSRRRFLSSAGAAAAAAFLSPLGHSARGDDKYGGFTMGLQTYTFRNFKFDQTLGIARELGIGTIEAFDAHFSSKSTPEQIDAAKRRCAELGLKILAHGVNPFTRDHEANRRWFEFARRAGIRNITADPSEDSFDSLDKLVAEYDIRVAIHNHGPAARYDKVADVLTAVKNHHPLIGACADLGHYIRSGEDPVKTIQLLKGRLFGVHLKDFAAPRADAAGTILGRGQLDVAGVFKALRQVEFPADACLALEYEEKADNPLADVRECLAAASEGARQSL